MFDWNDYFLLAQKLKENSSNSKIQNACLRSAISRAYYAAYNKASDFAKKDGFQIPEGEGKQKALCDYLKLHPNLPMSFVGQKLDNCRKARTDCDYDQRLEFDPSRKVTLVLQEVEYILSNLPN